MANQVIIPSDLVTASKNYMADTAALQYGKRIMDMDKVNEAIKLRYLLKALEMPYITTLTKNRIYQALLCIVPTYNVDTVPTLS